MGSKGRGWLPKSPSFTLISCQNPASHKRTTSECSTLRESELWTFSRSTEESGTFKSFKALALNFDLHTAIGCIQPTYSTDPRWPFSASQAMKAEKGFISFVTWLGPERWGTPLQVCRNGLRPELGSLHPTTWRNLCSSQSLDTYKKPAMEKQSFLVLWVLLFPSCYSIRHCWLIPVDFCVSSLLATECLGIEFFFLHMLWPGPRVALEAITVGCTCQVTCKGDSLLFQVMGSPRR